ncbi:BTAD domain-containing putative transcriptional regulator [Streptacidiphilus neutrinimicus]|uniref:BTAD domain-containing putative transcriptional regulator n=1 Tax=Streptacidiphilus neutrinimicus TaxID=105420 RepID=UPI002286E8F5|nr:BTAD domain-containing putative transcriptional regulator [Streptacidiphilus neutrinimicus]
MLAVSVLLEVCWALRHFSALRGPRGIALVTARRTLGSLLIGGVLVALLASARTPAPDASAEGSQIGAAPTAATAPLLTTPDENGPSRLVVRPGDTLWHLADSRLGDPLRWPEIYALNTHDTEADGRRFLDPNLIYPGWTLDLPDRQRPPVSAPTPRTTSGSASSTSPDGSGSVSRPEPSGAEDHHSSPAPQHAAIRTPHGLRLPREAGYVSVALATALAVNALQIKRRRIVRVPDGEEPPTLEQIKQRAEHHPLVADLRALQVQENLTPQEQFLPGVPLGEQGKDLLTLDALLHDLPVRALSATGPGAHDAVRALLLHILMPHTSPASVISTADDLRRLLGMEAPAVLPVQITVADDIEDALARLEELLIGRVRDQQDQDTHTPSPPLYLVTGQLADRQRRRLLSMLDVGAGLGVSTILLDTELDEGATVEVHHDGTARLHGVTAGPLRLFHLRVEGAQAFVRLLQTAEHVAHRGEELPAGSDPDGTESDGSARENPPDPENDPPSDPRPESDTEADSDDSSTTATSVTEIPQPAGPPANSTDQAPADDRHPASLVSLCQVLDPPAPHVAPITLTLLGPFTVHVNGTQNAGLSRGKIAELLAYLAVHDEGVTGDSIWQDLWPDRDGTSARDTFYRTSSNARARLREALGAGPGAQLILGNGTGRWHLDPQHFKSDLAAFHLARREADAASTPEARRTARERAAALHRGELCAGSTFGWIDAYREHARVQAVAALTELARTAEGIDEALSRLQQAVSLAPTDEALYLEQAQLHARTGNLAAISRTRDLMTRALSEIDTRLTPATNRAFEDLLRGRGHLAARPGAPR